MTCLLQSQMCFPIQNVENYSNTKKKKKKKDFLKICCGIWLKRSMYVPVAVAVLKDCFMVFADMRWLFYSGERIVAYGPLV